jgi:aryl-alcohol dehydrogenase-like predicted oxidoreductase
MLHRKLGNTGIAVSKIAPGTMYFGSQKTSARKTLSLMVATAPTRPSQ